MAIRVYWDDMKPFILPLLLVALAIIIYYILAKWSGDPLGVQTRAKQALNTGSSGGQPVSIVDNPDPSKAFMSWLGEVTTNTGLRW